MVVDAWLAMADPVGQLLTESCLSGQFDIRTRRSDVGCYQRAYDALEYRPVDYDPAMMDYQAAYMRGSGWHVSDLSGTIFLNGKPIGIGPLLLLQREMESKISSGPMALYPPLFHTTISPNSKRKLSKEWLMFVTLLARKAGVPVWLGEESMPCSGPLSDWHDLLMHGGARASLAHNLYVDLSMSLAEIRAQFRTSYKSLINKAERLWTVSVVDGTNGDSDWKRFHRLHAFVAGRETRSDETWRLQWENIVAGGGFLICLTDAAGEMVGGGYFHMTCDEGIYAVAAYDRRLFDKPLGHVVQMHAIRELASRGVRWYRVGRRFFSSEVPQPTDKELSISDFKSGFATHMFPVFRTENDVG